MKSVGSNSFADHENDRSAEKYEVRSLAENDFPRWDEFVRRSPQGTLFHSTLWLEAAAKPFRLLGCFRGTEMHGGCAVGLGGRRVASRPYPSLTPYFGVLYPPSLGKYVTSTSTNKEIANAFALFLKSEFDWINELPFSPEAVDMQPFMWQGFAIELRYTYRLRLGSVDTILANMDSVRRRNLASAIKQGIKIDLNGEFSEILDLNQKSFERQKTKSMHGAAACLFESRLRAANRCKGFLARNERGVPLGGVWIAWDEKRAYYLIGGHDHSTKSNSAVVLAMWHAIQFATNELNLREFDFEGSAIPSVESFFRKFGGTLTPYYCVSYRRPSAIRSSVRHLAIAVFGQRIADSLMRLLRG
jgi:hypothetical protein